MSHLWQQEGHPEKIAAQKNYILHIGTFELVDTGVHNVLRCFFLQADQKKCV